MYVCMYVCMQIVDEPACKVSSNVNDILRQYLILAEESTFLFPKTIIEAYK